MNNEKIEAMLASAVTHAAPELREQILENCDKTKGKIIVMKKKSVLKTVSAIAAVFVLLIAGIFIGKSLNPDADSPIADTLAAVVSLDVNPGVELQIDKSEKVLAAKGINTDGIAVLGDMELVGTDLDVAVNAVIGSMLRQGYIDEMANSILVSVAGKDGFDAKTLEAKLADNINGLVGNAAVLSQDVSAADDNTVALAEEYGISVGKASLINEIVASKEQHSFSELAGLSINELNLIGSTTEYKSVTTEGQASEKSYVGTDAALSTALNHAGLTRDKVSNIETELDYEHGVMTYEIEFDCGEDEYSYDINALTGEIIEYENEINGKETHGASTSAIPTTVKTTDSTDTQTSKKNENSGSNTISKDKAISVALERAGLSSDKVTGLTAHLDRDDGKLVYEIEFCSGSYEYSVDVNAATGKVIEFDKEYDDDADTAGKTEKQTSEDVISKDEAKSIALKKAGLTADKVTKLYADLENDDGKLVYEVEFNCDGYEYSVEINAATGSIIDYEKELDD